jgi:hypothetical protein
MTGGTDLPTMAALADDQPGGLMRHVTTTCWTTRWKESFLSNFVVECADGSVNAWISLEVEYSFEKMCSNILVKIVAAHVECPALTQTSE